jgi:hypothetical protein
MEELILNEFEKANCKPTHILMMRNFNFGLLKNMNPKQKEQFALAVQSLIDKGFVTYEDATSGPECLRLTELGFENLYSNSLSVEQIETLVLKEFEQQNSKSGHILTMKNLNFGLLSTFNPKEKELFAPAVNNIIEQGFITYERENSPMECLRLTDLGYEKLY